MLALLSRLISPRVAELESELNAERAECERFQNELNITEAKLTLLGKAYDQEVERNRLREDRLTELLIGTVTPLASSIPRHASPNGKKPDGLQDPGVIEPALSEADKESLRHRATEYCAQTMIDFTDEDVEKVYQQMLPNPQEWITN